MKQSEKEYFAETEKALIGLSVSEKLDFIKSNPYDFPSNSIVTPLGIPERIFNKHFKGGLLDPNFTFWFLKYNAKLLFNHTINSEEFKNKMNSELKQVFLNSELVELNKKEEEAKKLMSNKKLNIYSFHSNNYKYLREIALLRILDGNYFKTNPTLSVSSWDTFEVQSYSKHIYFKSFLVNELNLSSKSENSIEEINHEIDKIKEPDDGSSVQNLEFKHTEIFRNNAFLVWQSMFESFKISEKSRTDTRFMIDVMQSDELIHKGLSHKRILDWINDTYELAMGKIHYKDFKEDHKRNAIYKAAKKYYTHKGA